MTRAPLHLLVVDDETGMRLGIERTLQDFHVGPPDIEGEVGFTVGMAETGEEAVACIRERVPDILLLDYKLPGMNGLDVLVQTSEVAGDMLTIMITAYASIETAVAATRQGAYDFLPKPFTPAALRHIVRKAATRLVLARRARELEAEKRQVRFEFIRVLGHELKAPISAVAGYLYLLRDKTLGTQVEAYDELVGRSLQRLDQMTKMIQDLLDMTRIESGRKLRTLASLELATCAREAMEVGQAEASRRGITMALHSPDPLPILADRGEIDMILNNLISNAVKYNRDEGRVDITLERTGDTVTVRVADTGVGMSERERERLFGEFVRIKNAKTRHTLGSGLGLSILKRVVDMYEGTIDVQSEPDQGSTFTVTLKIVGDTTPTPEKTQT